MGKRAGKSGARARYKGYTLGPGGLKCPCCGSVWKASKKIRKKEKNEAQTLVRELNSC